VERKTTTQSINSLSLLMCCVGSGVRALATWSRRVRLDRLWRLAHTRRRRGPHLTYEVSQMRSHLAEEDKDLQTRSSPHRRGLTDEDLTDEDLTS